MQDKINEKNEEQQILDIFNGKDNANKTANLIHEMLEDYKTKPENISLSVWMQEQFKKHLIIDMETDVVKKDVVDIVKSISIADKSYQELTENEENDIPESKWLEKKIEEGAKVANITNIASYVNDIDQSLIQANDQAFKTFTNIDGSVNQNTNLHGFVAEAHHVNSFNIEAAQNDSDYFARMLEGNGKNSVDIVIDDVDGKIVKRYQSKYGYSSKATESYLQDGDYRGQRKLVPSGQETDINGATSSIESPDGIKSAPLTYEQSQEIKEQIQVKQEIHEYKWDGLDKISATKSIIANTGQMVAFHALFQGGRVFAQRVIKFAKGEKQNTIKEDLQEWFNSSFMGAKNIAIHSVVSGAILISARNGWLTPLQHTPAGKIASIVYVGLQNAKILYKIGQGKLAFTKGLQEMQKTTLSAVGGLIGAGKGAILGAPAGPIGSFVGMIVGGIAGSSTGELISNGFNKLKPTLKSVVKKAYAKTKTSVKTYLRNLNPMNLLFN